MSIDIQYTAESKALSGYELPMADRLQALYNEIEQIAIDAEDIGWRAVNHKLEATLCDMSSAVTAAEQYVTGEL